MRFSVFLTLLVVLSCLFVSGISVVPKSSCVVDVNLFRTFFTRTSVVNNMAHPITFNNTSCYFDVIQPGGTDHFSTCSSDTTLYDGNTFCWVFGFTCYGGDCDLQLSGALTPQITCESCSGSESESNGTLSYTSSSSPL